VQLFLIIMSLPYCGNITMLYVCSREEPRSEKKVYILPIFSTGKLLVLDKTEVEPMSLLRIHCGEAAFNRQYPLWGLHIARRSLPNFGRRGGNKELFFCIEALQTPKHLAFLSVKYLLLYC
jgi:hypothetical protein